MLGPMLGEKRIKKISMKNVMVVTGNFMQSVNNEAGKIKQTFNNNGIDCDIYRCDSDNPLKTRIPKYDLAIWWTPFLQQYFNRQKPWLNAAKENLAVSYYVIEGIPTWIKGHKNWLDWQYIVAPSKFTAKIIESCGVKVREVIPHQIPAILTIDAEYGEKWRNNLPTNKKILLYNGTQILRKQLPKLNQAIKILSAKRNDFLMVYHTDKVKQDFHTNLSELDAPNTVIQSDFTLLTIEQTLAKMYYSDIVVHPAVTEGFGLPVLEALALGKPLVCIDANGVNEIASVDNSFMVTKVKQSILKWPGYLDFKISDYEPIDLAEQIELALDATPELIEKKRFNGLLDTKRFNRAYDSFLKFL